MLLFIILVPKMDTANNFNPLLYTERCYHRVKFVGRRLPLDACACAKALALLKE